MGGANGAGTANGDDTFNGLGGTDSVTYTHNTSSPSQPINVTINGLPDDGDGISGIDNVHTDIETVYGGADGDKIDADFPGVAGVSLFGRDGADTLTGSDEPDFLDGEVGADTLDCQAETDMYRHDGNGPEPVNCETLVP